MLHWTIAILVIGQIGLGFITDAAEQEKAADLVVIHAELGLTLLALMVLRLSWRIAVPPPPLPPSTPPRNRALAQLTHRLIYLFIFLMLFSGIGLWLYIGRPLDLLWLFPLSFPDLSTADEQWRSVAGYTHEYGAWAISMLAVLHVAGALWHELVLRDRLIRDRMM